MPQESRIDATDRLRREGRWAEASLFRDATIKQLRADGICRTEASEAAWDRMLDKYPPLPQEESDAGLCDYPWPDTPATPQRLLADIEWVYRSLGEPMQPKDAPTSGAWGLWRWARQNPGHFFKNFLLRVMLGTPKKAQGEEDDDAEFEQLRQLMRRDFTR
jgi:hypothetical protein